MNKKEIIFFDLDGTIVDSAPGIKESVKYALNTLGIKEEDEEKLNIFIGPPLFDAFSSVYNLKKEDADFAVSKYRENYNQNKAIEKFKVYDGVEKMLNELKKKGYKLGVISNKPHEDTIEVVNYYFPNMFDYIVGAQDKVNRKPDPMAMNILLEHFGYNMSDVAYIGDSRYDAMFSENCGCDYYLFTYGYDKLEAIKTFKPVEFLNESKDLLIYF